MLSPMWRASCFTKFMAVGEGGTILYSTDSKVWKQSTKVTPHNLNAIATNGSLAIAVGDNGADGNELITGDIVGEVGH